MVTSYSSDTDADFPSLDTLLRAAKRVSDNAKGGAGRGNGKESPALTKATPAPGGSHPRPNSQEQSADEVKWPSLTGSFSVTVASKHY